MNNGFTLVAMDDERYPMKAFFKCDDTKQNFHSANRVRSTSCFANLRARSDSHPGALMLALFNIW